MPESSFELTSDDKRALLERYREKPIPVGGLRYGTVADFCDSADHIQWLAHIQGDLKDLQRPAALKALIGLLPPGSRLLEIGAGEPHVANILAGVGYNVLVVDPYDGSGRGPIEYDFYKQKYPEVQLYRDVFSPELSHLEPSSVDCIYSISVLEHVHQPALNQVFAGIRRFLRPGGFSFHLIDHVLDGSEAEFHVRHLAQITCLQFALSEAAPEEAVAQSVHVLHKAGTDLDTYYLSAEGHNQWRGSTPYQQFPFRKIISVQTCQKFTGAPQVNP